MPDDREQILGRVNRALAPLTERAALPEYAGDLAVMRRLVAGLDPFTVFAERIALVNGRAITDPSALVAQLREGKWMHGYCDPALWPMLAPHFGPDFTVETEYDRTRIDDFAFGITRASGGIAETGTIILKDAATSRRLGALAPWVHIAVLRRSEIFSDLSQAVGALGDDPNVIWCTGSSSTADVEGILIRGVHGPGVQIALVIEP
jgi:L-lactate dehydrogenase complex protein LldG